MKKMNVLFIGYWNLDDPLTSATIFPHLSILSKHDRVNSLIFTNTQREMGSVEKVNYLKESGIVYYPLLSQNYHLTLITKIIDFVTFPKKILKICQDNSVDLIIARGAPAGALALLVTNKNDLPFVVESFEPHADYMLETGTWSKYDPRFIAQKHWEGKIKKKAKFILTVSENYESFLKKEGVAPDKVFTAPCGVNIKKFFYDPYKSQDVRKNLNIPSGTKVAIYVGKFGGIYYGDEIFILLKKMLSYYNDNLFVIILSNIEEEEFRKKCFLYAISSNNVKKLFVPHEEVNAYLSAADFAVAPYRKTKVSKYLSPVKVGEYLAAGLPVLITEGVGDEMNYLERNHLGVTLNIHMMDEDTYFKSKMDKINKIVEIRDHGYFVKNALKYRSFEVVENLYDKILNA
ncbi:glycosyltransferase [Fulvivirga maritima]|uniref:glycosyltransferase n=1 Tax=Fulvivirga maritima TaxID=2904247 RepID=UPI001F3CA7C3|nr:glycosyltransferase [Fulvivirga maritima]UII27784.1 glycosyltransferase [Fulvivirga maritima]